MPKVPGTYALSPYTSYNVNGLITGADYNAVTHEIVLIGYFSGHSNSFLWFLSDFHGDMFFSGNKRRIEINNGTEWQSEGVCWMSNNRFAVSCETSLNPASLYFGVNTFSTTSVKTNISTLSCDVYPSPTSGTVFIDNMTADATYRILNLTGQTVLSGNLNVGNNSVNFRKYQAGIYIIVITNQCGERTVARFTKQ